MAILHFLLIYNAKVGTLVSCKSFEDAQLAMTAFASAEVEHARDADLQVLLLGSDSLDSLKATHSHYFTEMSGAESMRLLAGV